MRRAMLFVTGAAALVSLALVAQAPPPKVAAAPGKAAARAAAAAGHPGGVLPSEDCIACHAELTPEIQAEWHASPHGINNVKCLVCHGGTGSDFTRKPPPSHCLGCHAQQVESLEREHMRGKDCFSCHTPHALRPHRH